MMSSVNYDLVIVGAGAAGLSAGIAFLRKASRENGVPKVLIIEANDEAGRKLLATGNGRCNLTNVAADGYKQTVEFFRSLGVLTTVDAAGRVYPLSKRAVAVRDALLTEVSALGAEIRYNARVISVEVGSNDDFIVVLDDSKGKGWIPGRARDDRGSSVRDDEFNGVRDDIRVIAWQVIVAAGSKAGSQYGATGDSYAIARELGIEVSSISPALVAFAIAEGQRKLFKPLAGVRANAKVRLISGSDVVSESEGEVQFTEKSISGICIFDLSLGYSEMDSARACPAPSGAPLRSAQNDRRREKDDSVQNDRRSDSRVLIDFAPGFSEKEISVLLGENLAAELAGVVHEKLAAYILRHCEEQRESQPRPRACPTPGSASPQSQPRHIGYRVPDTGYATIQSLNEDELPILCAHMIKNFIVPISGTLGWKDAQVTSGGVKFSELDEAHMESTKCLGVYFVGEAVDYTGQCGGFNLDFAWNSGIKAGKRAAWFYNYTLRE